MKEGDPKRHVHLPSAIFQGQDAVSLRVENWGLTSWHYTQSQCPHRQWDHTFDGSFDSGQNKVPEISLAFVFHKKIWWDWRRRRDWIDRIDQMGKSLPSLKPTVRPWKLAETQKETIIFKPSIFRGEVLVLGSLEVNMEHKKSPSWKGKASSIHLHFWVQNVNFQRCNLNQLGGENGSS